MSTEFTLKYTNAVKGIAIIFLLIHHLFYYCEPSLYSDILFMFRGKEFSLFNFLAYFSKITVWLFVIMSSYGLYKSSIGSLKNFYIKRFGKIYLNYWFIWLIFVPLGVLFFKRTFPIVYETINYFPKLIINILGIQEFFGFYGYNQDWWFISLILFLYLIFPVIYYQLKNSPKVLDIFFLLTLFIVSLFKIKLYHFGFIFVYLCPFYFGAFCAKYDLFKNMKVWCKKYSVNICLWSLIILLAIVRFYLTFNRGAGFCSYVDTILAYLIIQTLFNNFKENGYVVNSLANLGKHAFNIFLFSRFLYEFYFKNYIYALKYPLIIFIACLVLCIVVSILLNYIKSYLFKRIIKN